MRIGPLRARTVQRIAVVLAITLVSAAMGGLTANLFDAGSVADRIVTSALAGTCLSLLEITLQGPGAALLWRLPMLAALALRVALYLAIFLGLLWLTIEDRRIELALTGGNLVMLASLSLAFNAVFVLRRLLGPGTLAALLIGRYHRPRPEQRIVLFMDLIGSTQLAERLGDLAFHRFVNRVLFDITDPVLEAGGEIYRYVGDEVIVTWPIARGLRDAACLTCVLAIAARLEQRAPDYQRQFGATPRLRSALHAGHLIIGEMGDFKREIVMLGDTMNTTARIEDACRSFGQDIIASAEVIHALTLPAGITAESLGVVELRGKAAALELFAVHRPEARTC